MNFSVIDYIGVLNDGVGILLSLNLKDSIYEFIYWFNKDGSYRLVCEESFLKLINEKSIYDFKMLDNLLDKIEEVIPDKVNILKEFGLIE